ncbi:MAG: VCBS repeat-containing protein [Acidobacteria bacterium]|nr:VCBS repeat-containing protein [Acidobacteriota bacterium]
MKRQLITLSITLCLLLGLTFWQRPQAITVKAAPPAVACSTASFSTATNFATGSNTFPYSVAVGDFNGDSRLDLVTANLFTGNVALLLGNGMGGFGAATLFGMGVLPDAVAAADVNGDGKLDIITADAGDNGGRVSVRLGDGMGGFGARTFFNLFGFGFNTVEPHDIVASDLNGDGKLDLITANFESDNAAVLLNNCTAPCATPSFANPVFYATGLNAGSVAVGDVNGDGKRDLVVTNHNSSNVSVLLGNGNGTFQTAVNFNPNGQPLAVTLGDVNGDGKPDLLVANDNQDQVAVLLNTYTAPTFNTSSFGAATSFNAGDHPLAIDTGDFDSDGKLDVVTANLSASNVTVLLGNGMGGFGTAKPFAVAAAPRWVAARDFNGDGKLDLVTPTDADNVSVLLNNCLPNQAPTITALGVARNAGAPASNSAIATVSDAEDAENTLSVTVNNAGSATVNGVTVSNISVDSSGNVTADVAAVCASSSASFTLRVTDSGTLAATATLTVTVTHAATPLAINVPATQPSCNGATNGSLTINVDNGTGPFQYSIDNGAHFSSTATFTGLGAGTYNVIVKDAYDCNRAMVNIVLGQPAALSFTTTPVSPTCNGGMDGSLTINATGGTGAKQYSINNGTSFSNTPTFSGLGAGTYPVVVKDANNCQTAAANVTLTPPTAISFTTTPVNPSCNGGTNGSLTINATGGTGALQYSINNGQSFSANAQFNGLGAGTYQVIVKDANNCQTAAATVTLAQPNALAFNVTPVAPTCNGGTNGSLTIQATGGTGALLYSINNGQSFGSNPVFTDLAAGLYPVVVKDANQCFSAAQTITLTQPAALALSPAALPTGFAGQSFTQVFTASGGTGTKSISLAGALPNWLSFTPATATLSGTAPQPATVSFALVVTDQAGCTARFNYTLNFVCPSITLAPASLPNAAINTAYPQTLTASPTGTYSFAVTSGLLPAGLTLNSNGGFGGAPMQSGVFNFRVTASGFGVCSGFRDYVLQVDCPGVTLTPASLPGGLLGVAYNQSVAATPAGSYSYSVTSGALPAGLTLNTATGALTGTPTQSGTFTFTIRASAGNCAGSQGYSVTIGCSSLLFATTSPLTAGQAGIAYTQTIAVTPAGSYTFALAQGNLPSGLTLNAATGVISGLPLVTGTYNFMLRAQTAGGCSATQAYALTITCPTVALSALPTPTLNTAYSQMVSASPAGGNYVYAVSSGALPAGLALNVATGALTGTPTVAGAYSITITATGFGACTGGRTYSGVIANTCPTITLSALPNGQPGQLYSQVVTGSPSATYAYTVTAGSVPPGLTFIAAGGLLYGYPMAAGTYNFTLTATNANQCTGQRTYTLVIGSAAAALALQADYDGDGQADLALWSAGTGVWNIVRSSDQQAVQQSWGTAGDVTLLGDYDGDGKSDLAVFRPSNATFYVKRSRDGGYLVKAWGLSTDVPVPGDYDGDGQTDVAVFRPSEGNWYVLRSSDQQYAVTAWGAGSAPYYDVPVAGDYDGDGKTDVAVFRRGLLAGGGAWLIKCSRDGQYLVKQWGLATDVPVPGDYDGDGKTDLAVWRGSTGTWYLWQSATQAYRIVQWGTLNDQAGAGDYDGDGRADLAVWRAAERNWYIKCSATETILTKAQGQAGDALVTVRPSR